MENRDRDEMIENSDIPSNIGKEKEKSDSESSFDQGIGRSESWDSEPSRRSGSDSDSNLGEQTDPSSGRKGDSWSESEH